MTEYSGLIIGIPVQRRQPESVMSVAPAYTDTLASFGAAPLVLPLFDPLITASVVAPLLALCNGFLLTGSVADVHPQRYAAGEIPEGGYCDVRRDALDWAILDHAARTDKPVFGICRGCQVMNVYRGGTLAWRYRDILPETFVEHARSDIASESAHTITWAKDSWLLDQMSMATQGVNSLHQQVCAEVAPSLKTAALSEDGLVEAVEDCQFPERFFGVQWHPELLIAGGDAASEILFARFLQACQRRSVNSLVVSLSDSAGLTAVY